MAIREISMRLKEASRHWRDPSKLTPYEEKIYHMRKEGMTHKQISEALGLKNYASLSSTIRVINEKLLAQQHEMS